MTNLRMRAFALMLGIGSSLVAGCGGGGSTPADPPTPTPVVPVQFSVLVGSAQSAAHSRRSEPQYLSAGAESISVRLSTIAPQPPGPVTMIDLQAGAADCAAGAAGTSCTGTVQAPVGQQQFIVSTYSQPNGGGALLSTGAITIVVQAGGTQSLSNATSLTLNAIVASVTVAAAPMTATEGQASTFGVTVTARDATGAIIVGPGNYSLPVLLTLNDPNFFLVDSSGRPIFTQQNVTGPGAAISVPYIGAGRFSAPQGGTATITATAQGLTESATVLTFLPAQTGPTGPTPTPGPTLTPIPTASSSATPSPTPTPVNAFNVTPSSMTFAGIAPQPTQTFNASENGVSNFSAVSQNTAVATVSGSGSTFVVTAGATVGQTDIVVSDPAGNRAYVTVIVSGQTIVIQSHKEKS